MTNDERNPNSEIQTSESGVHAFRSSFRFRHYRVGVARLLRVGGGCAGTRAQVHGRGRENAVGRGVPGEVEEFQDVGAETQEFGTAALTGPIEGDADGPFDSAR